MNIPISVNDIITLKNGFKGRVISIDIENILVESNLGERELISIHCLENIEVKFNFPSYKDALYHASESIKSAHCEFCSIARLYSHELIQKELLIELFPERVEIIFKGVLSYISKEFSSCCFYLLPQIDGVINKRLINEGLLKYGKTYPLWTNKHPLSMKHNKPCKNLSEAIIGAAEAKELSSYSHIYEWVTENNIENMRILRNKLLHGELTKENEHEASLVIIILESISHGN